ncbi:MAG: hypothetical protein HY960_07185 [Ignavibacteriae bacterium]|nr:hypothetical protein [Ignavibacteriota bacterium]
MVNSKNKIPIRLTEERWFHIIENHDDIAGYYDTVLETIEDPDFIIEGYRDALIALKTINKKKMLAAVYKELSSKDGFVITAYFTNKLQLNKVNILWAKKQN